MDGTLQINDNSNILEIINNEFLIEQIDNSSVDLIEIKQEVEILESISRGIPGVSRENTYASLSERFIVTDTIETSYSLQHIPKQFSLQMFLNGLRETVDSNNLSGNIIDFSRLELGLGDELVFDYIYQIN